MASVASASPRGVMAGRQSPRHHVYAFALHTMHHNFVKISGAHRMTPAMKAGVDSRLWEIGDIVKVVED